MYELQEGHRIVEDMMRKFCEKEIAPRVEDMQEGRLPMLEVVNNMMDKLGIRKMARDLISKTLQKEQDSPEQGGSKGLLPADGQFDPMIMAIVAKELCRVDPSIMMFLSASLGLCGGTIMTRGTIEQKKKYGQPLFTMEKTGCWGMTEPESGSDAFALTTTARPAGDGYVINGSKTFITNAPIADIFVIYARVDRGEGSMSRVYPFVMERGIEGLSTSEPMKKMGMHGSATGQIFLEDVQVSKQHLLGESEGGQSRDQVKQMFHSERAGAPFMAWGIIERCLDDCLDYAIERKQFGKSIAEFQLIQGKIAKMYIALENVKNLAFKQAWMMVQGKGEAEEFCAAKYYSAKVAVEVSLEAIQLMGGYGYMREYHVEMLMRDAKLLGIGGGTDEIQLLNIARSLLAKKGFDISIA